MRPLPAGGRYSLVASIIGYKTETRDLDIADADVVVELRLEKHAIEVEATVVEAKREKVLSHEDQVTLAGYTGQDNLQYGFEEFDLDLEWGNRTVNSRWTHVFDSSLFGNFLVTGSRFRASTLFFFEDVSGRRRPSPGKRPSPRRWGIPSPTCSGSETASATSTTPGSSPGNPVRRPRGISSSSRRWR